MCIYKIFATFLCLNSGSSFLIAVRIFAHSFATTARSSAAVLLLRTALIRSLKRNEDIVSPLTLIRDYPLLIVQLHQGRSSPFSFKALRGDVRVRQQGV